MLPSRIAISCLLWALVAVAASTAERLEELLRTDPQPNAHVYATVDGIALQLHAFTPRDQGPGPWPLAVVIHGGGWGGSSPEIMFAHCRFLAARGLVAVAPAYRLTSRGGVGVADCLADCRAALRWTVANAAMLHADPRRIVLIGESAGGHLAAGVAMIPDGQEMPAIAGLCLINPVVDIAALSWWKGIPGMRLDDVATSDSRHPAFRLSPINHIRAGLPPTRIMHGEQDVSVPIAQVDRFAQLMREAGNRCELIRLPATGHAFLLPGYGTPETILRGLDDMARFLAGLGLAIDAGR